MAEPWILGYATTHNGAVCLLRGDELVVAVQEERLKGLKRARIKKLEDSLAFGYCLDYAGIKADDLDAIVGACFSGGASAGGAVTRYGWRGLSLTIPHHFGHAVGALATSGFEDAAILIVDGQGGSEDYLPDSELRNVKRSDVPGLREYYETITIYGAAGTQLEVLEKHLGEWIPEMQNLRHGHGMQAFGSLGGMYSAAAHQIFGDAMDAGKVMGLASHGKPAFPAEKFFDIREDGGFAFHDEVTHSFKGSERWPNNRNASENLAASVQRALEHALDHLVRHTREISGKRNLCLAGGVALNAVANEKIIAANIFDDVFIMPAAEDSGTAIGAAYYGLWQLKGSHRRCRAVHDATGRAYSKEEIQQAIAATPGIETVKVDDPLDAVVDLLCKGKTMGWFQGRSELGPRALGQRSILADARAAGAKSNLNLKVKKRESFRPFAPLILEEEVANWFVEPEHQPTSPVMLRTFPFRPEAATRVPAVVHNDGTGRLQTLARDANPRLYDLLSRFHERTGVPILLNTSLNVMGEPIVETPEDALWCLLTTGLDYCCLEGTMVRTAPGYKSILDLYPSVIAESFIVEGPVREGGLNLRVTGETRFRLKVGTPWGEATIDVPQLSIPILMHADGKKSGRDIHNLVRSNAAFNENTFDAMLKHLRRAHVLSFSAVPRDQI